jgi:hypothetical protein
MSNERTQAYRRVMQTLADIGPAKLQASEQQRIRDAADTLVLSPGGEDVRAALLDMSELAEHLLCSGRWIDDSVDVLLADIVACGPASAMQRPQLAA